MTEDSSSTDMATFGIVGIVAVVAVVGLVGLFQNSGSSTITVPTQSTAGTAVESPAMTNHNNGNTTLSPSQVGENIAQQATQSGNTAGQAFTTTCTTSCGPGGAGYSGTSNEFDSCVDSCLMAIHAVIE